MQKLKRGLATLLAMLMLVSVLPATALAEELQEGTVGETAETTLVDEVIYNLLDMEVTVGADEARAASGEPYVLFDANGDYTIELEENAFFPYEVQFIYNGNTWNHWFMDPEDTVEIGGHTFSVTSQRTDPYTLTQFGVTVNGTYVPAYPEEKTFTEMPGWAPFSLLPLREVSVSLNLAGYLPEELKAVQVSTVLTAVPGFSGDQVVWAKEYDDNFVIVNRDGTMDLTPDYERDTYVRLELIVGSTDQLDPNNTRYLVTVNITPSEDLLVFEAATSAREEIEVFDSYMYERRDGYDLTLTVDSTKWTSGEQAYVAMKVNPLFSALDATVYVGYYETEEAATAAGAADLTAQIWNQSDLTAAGGYLGDYSWSADQDQAFTVVLKREGVAVKTMPFFLRMNESSTNAWVQGLYADEGSYRTNVYNGLNQNWDNGINTFEIRLDDGYALDGEYYLGLTMNSDEDIPDADRYGLCYVEHAAVGAFSTAEEIKAQTDIKAQLFSDAYTNGYRANFENGVTFSVLDIYGEIQTFVVRTGIKEEIENLPDAPKPGLADTYFRMESADEQDGTYISSYMMPYDADGYYYNGYQTVFLLKNTEGVYGPVAAGEIIPDFYTGNKVTMYAGHNGVSGTKQESGVTPVTFANGEPIQYSAAAENGTHLKNYWVTFLTQVEGAKLFVNGTNDESRYEDGMPVREVFLDDDHDNRHDVFIANIGDTPLTGLYVRLEDAQNVALDPYWTIQDTSTKTLAAFSTTRREDPDGDWASYGELPNVAKIRLIPDAESCGIISGTLVIGSENGGEMKIKLTGTSGAPKITTASIVDGVKYVPYSSLIQTNNMYASDAVEFKLTAGQLPGGVIIKPNGEIYGVPLAAGEFTFTVTATYKDDPTLSDSKEFTLTILENTWTNVWNATDTNYELLESLPDIIEVREDQIFWSAGIFANFVDFWLDGKKLIRDVDYFAEEGSTKITISSETIDNAGEGEHTIAAEFRDGGAEDEDSPLKRTAQNYTLDLPDSGGGDPVPPVYPQPPKPSKPKPDPKPEPEPEPEDGVFRDVESDDWFYSDVYWAYDNELMFGVTPTLFAPDGLTSLPMVVTVLARMNEVDLSKYEGHSYIDILPDQWYTDAAIWARENSLLADEPFTADPPLARGKMAVILVKYLKHIGIDCTLPEERVAFEDADLMTQEENDAFQVLYHFGIFKGVGNYKMDVQGATSRAQLAALLHRLSVFEENYRQL